HFHVTGVQTCALPSSDQAGNYTVTVSNSDCSATSAAVVVTMMELEMPVITASGPTTICEGDNVTLTAAGGANGNYIWTLDGSPRSEERRVGEEGSARS